MIIIFKVLYLSHTSLALKHCIGPLLSSEACTGVFFNCLPPHFQKRHDKFAQPTRSLLTLKSNVWPISPLKLQCKTSKWRQEPIYGSKTLKIVLWAYLNIFSYLVKRAWGKKVFLGLHTTQVWHKNIVWILSHLLIRNVLQVLPASSPLCPFPSPTQPYDCSDRLSKQSQCRQRRTQGQFLPHPLGIRCPPSQARGSSL